ncbi:polysaccharide deacetylase [Rhodoplanes elegans]|uniref:Chitooligosaccharide deacetylase n=1 Tax=Rhodoplanes elegans TaxID=29408 RepID=A0A327KIS6_9BRAD|nr:polysaccharide deacetylase family protein [Rhodoplanes elegans]MBK5957827.1 polysaccharide deacetylase [Rhodoplanes elegans]RAI38011.1 polysaccharide deacetylase [Rhodoplanes elegans]
MYQLKRAIIRSGLEALYFSGAHRLMRPVLGGVGAILMLHHVRPARPDGFQPNQLLEITPDFLEHVVARLVRSKVDFVSLDEVYRRLSERDFGRRFVAFTFDDGYRDNKDFAYPILKRHGIPFAVYVPTSFPDRLGELWWAALEAVIAQNDKIVLEMDGRDCRIACATTAEKSEAFALLYCWLRRMPTDAQMLEAVRELTARYRVDSAAICDSLCMSWEEIRALAADPLVTIGAHTVNHVMLAKACDTVARSELKMGSAVLEAALGAAPRHLAYPYGDATAAGPREFAIAAELGFKTAVTTRPGVLFPEHAETLTALPRISINGEFQRGRYVDVLLSGTGTALWNGLRKLSAA